MRRIVFTRFLPRLVYFALLLGLAAPGVAAAATGFIECEAELTNYEIDQPYSEDAGGIHSDYRAPVATFSVIVPSEFAGRTVHVIFLSTTYDELQGTLENGIGAEFILKLPNDYFDYPDGAIIKGFLLLSISPKERHPATNG